MNIVTCICVDKDEKDDSIYPQMNYRTSRQRRLIYWKCAAVSFATSIRCNPGIRHILYTNDLAPVRYKGRDLRTFLTDMGIEIRYLPFEVFKPLPGLSKKFKNAFYKLDVIRELGKFVNQYSIVLDSDCVWVKNNQSFFQSLDQEKLLVYDCYQHKDPYEKRSGLSRIELGEVFKKIDPTYPVAAPIHYGGEILGAKGSMFRNIANQMHNFFRHIIHKFGNQPPVFTNGNSIFDYNEYIASYVYNKMPEKLIDAREFIRRMATPVNEKSLESMHHTVWHLFAEKKLGFMILFKKVYNQKSVFWKTPVSKLDEYVGMCMGVPYRKSKLENIYLKFCKVWFAVQFIVWQKLRKLSF